MTAMTARRTRVLTIAVTLVWTIGIAAVRGAPAMAEPCSSCRPWWHLSTISAPPEHAGGQGQVIVEATNLGDSVADGRFSPITVVDELPAGVRPTTVYGEGGGGQSGATEERQKTEEKLGHSNCSISGRTVACVYEWPLMAYERLSVAIDVEVLAPGAGEGVNMASVSGGGAAKLVSRRALSLEGPGPFGIQNYEVSPEEEGGAPARQAGAHPFQMTTTFALNAQLAPVVNGKEEHVLEAQPLALVKDLSFKLPAGLVGNAALLPKCSTYIFTQETKSIPGFKCPDDTVVGVATSIVNILPTGGAEHVPGTLTEPVYNLEPAAGEPARFGFTTPAKVGAVLDTAVRTGSDYGVTVSVPAITQLSAFIGSQVTLWGVPSDARHDSQRGSKCLAGISGQKLVETGVEQSCPLGKEEPPFLVMPTTCEGPPHTSVEGDSWAQPGRLAFKESVFQNDEGEPFGFDGCDRLGFAPQIDVAPDTQQAATPASLHVEVRVPQEDSMTVRGTASATIKDTTVVLPEGMTLDPSGANGLEACTEAEIGFQGSEEAAGVMASNVFTPTLPNPFCPDGAKLGTVQIRTPLLPNPLVGGVYLASPAPQGEAGRNPFRSLLAMYIVAEEPASGVLVKLPGKVLTDSATGRLTTTFSDTPDLPFEALSLDFFGGPQAPLTTPSSCGSYSTAASFVPSSGNPAVQAISPPFDIVSGPHEAPCESPLPFDASMTAGATNIQAGAFAPLATTISRQDGEQPLQAVTLHLPPGLSGVLAGVKLCGEAEGNAGTCGPESLIGETTVNAGAGASPLTLRGGRVYLTGPYRGAPFGLSIVTPVKAGPFDLGEVVVRARVEVNPLTAAISVATDETGPYRIPQIIRGIPAQLRDVSVTVNRRHFTFNPTNCARLGVIGTLVGAQSASRTLKVPFQVANCATLRFKPRLTVSTSARASRVFGESLDAKLSYPRFQPGSQANIARVKVTLPKQLPSRLETLRKACPDTVFTRNPAGCPAISRVGSGRASTPVLPVPLSGPAYFVSHGGAKFPELVIVLQGYGVTIDLHGETLIKSGITTTAFNTVPDVPVTSFELKLPKGRHSALGAQGSLCKHALKMPTVFTAQNGLVIHSSTKIAVAGCRASKRTGRGNRHRRARRRRK